MTPEARFKAVVVRDLNKFERCYFFSKVADGVRGIPDLICCINGTFVALELKKSEAEANKSSGRIVLQRRIIRTIKASGGYACITYPENWQEILEDIKRIHNDQRRGLQAPS